MPEDTAKENTNGSDWADFRPPPPTPVGSGSVVSPGLTIPEVPSAPSGDPAQDEVAAADTPVVTEPEVTVPQPLDPPAPSSDPLPPEPQLAPLPEATPAVTDQVPVATSELPVPSLPLPSVTPVVKVSPPESTAPEVGLPKPQEPAEPAQPAELQSLPAVTPEAAPEPPPEVAPEPLPIPIEELPPKPPPVQLTTGSPAATTFAPTSAQAGPMVSRKLGLLLLMVIILGAVGGGGYYAYANNLLPVSLPPLTLPSISWPSISLPFGGSSTPPPAATENQSILSQALGPATWENNYSTNLLPTEKGGLDFQVTDPASAASPAATAATTADLSLFKSLVIKIAKVEVHLATRSVIATNVSSTHSADQAADHWETLRIEDNATVDLLALRSQGGAISDLGVTYLAAGHYTEVRVYVTSASAVTSDGATINVTIPGDTGIVKIVKPFDVTATGTKAILVDFDATKMILQSGSTYQLQPVVGQVLFDGRPI